MIMNGCHSINLHVATSQGRTQDSYIVEPLSIIGTSDELSPSLYIAATYFSPDCQQQYMY